MDALQTKADPPPPDGTPSDGVAAEGAVETPLSKSSRKLLIARANRLARSILGELTAIVLGLALAWFGAVNWVMARGSVDLSAFRTNAARSFAHAFEGRDAEIGRLVLDYRPDRGAITVRGRDIVVSADGGLGVATLSAVDADLSLAGLLGGRVDPISVDIVGGVVSAVRKMDGPWRIGIGAPEAIHRSGFTIDVDPQAERSPLDLNLRGLRSVRLREASLRIRDERDGLTLDADIAGLDLADTGEVLNIALNARAEDASASVRAMTSRDAEDVDIDIALTDFDPARFAAQTGPTARLSPLALPLDVTATLVSRRGTGLERIDLSLDAGQGTIFGRALDDARLLASYDKSSETLQIDQFDLRADRSVVAATGAVRGIGTPATGFFQTDFDIALDGDPTTLAVPGLPVGEIDLERWRLRAAVNPADQAVNVSDLRLTSSSIDLSATATLARQDGRLSQVTAEGQLGGALSPAELLAYWPEGFVGGARRWVDRSVRDGTLSEIEFAVDLDPREFQRFDTVANQAVLDGLAATGVDVSGETPASLARQFVLANSVALDFAVTDGTVRYISTMPVLAGVSGRGRIADNRLDFDFAGGQVDSLRIAGGEVDIPALIPKGGDFTIAARGDGDIPAMLRLIDQPPFEFATRYGIDPAQFGGSGQIALSITRPLLEFFAQDRVRYGVEGEFVGVSAPFRIGSVALTDGAVRLFADATKLSLRGPVRLGPWLADMTYLDTLGERVTPTRATLSGQLSRDDLDGLGIGLREFFDGSVPINVDAVLDGLDIAEADIVADLTPTRMQVGNLWTKAEAAPARLRGTLSRADGASTIDDLSITAPGMDVAGRAAFAADMSLVGLSLDRVDVDGFADLAFDLAPNAERDRLVLNVTGDYLNLAPTVAAALRRTGQPLGLPLDVSGDMAVLSLAEDYPVTEAAFTYRSTAVGVDGLTVSGRTPAGPVELNLATSASEGPSDAGRTLSVSIPDASAAAQSFFGLGSVEEGVMEIFARLPAPGEDGAITGVLNVADFKLTRTPILARMLSLASLTGLGDALSGQGLRFDDLEVPFAWEAGVLRIRDARAEGPALGLTGSGDIDTVGSTLDIDGVLVPAYSTSSFLGDIPLIGDIFVGDSGVLGLSYSVVGPMEATQVAVNPLSALAPGVLKEMFKKQRDDIPSVEADADTAD